MANQQGDETKGRGKGGGDDLLIIRWEAMTAGSGSRSYDGDGLGHDEPRQWVVIT